MLDVKPAVAILQRREKVGNQWRNVEYREPIPGYWDASYENFGALARTPLSAIALCMAQARGLLVPFADSGDEGEIMERIEQAEAAHAGGVEP